MPRTKGGTIVAMGILPYLDANFGVGSGNKFVNMVTEGASDQIIADAFSTELKPIKRQTAAFWRKHYYKGNRGRG